MNNRLKNSSISKDAERDENDDHRWVTQAQSGDAEAFRVLFERYHRRIFATALGVVRNRDDAFDVVQEAFIKAYRHLAKFEGNSSFYTWVYRIAMNLCIDHIRKSKRAPHVDYDDDLASGDEAAGELVPRVLGQDPQRSLLRRELGEQISAALERLSDNHRAVLVMREYEGLSYQEMADIMNVSKGTIMSRLFHARKNMQEELMNLMGDGAMTDAGVSR